MKIARNTDGADKVLLETYAVLLYKNIFSLAAWYYKRCINDQQMHFISIGLLF